MRRVLQILALASLLAASNPPASAEPAPKCQRQALEHLDAKAPDGTSIFKRINRPDFFLGWIDCEDAQFSLPTAVHESTHYITSEIDAFPLVGGGAVARPHEVSAFFPPARIADRFAPDDFVATYLGEGKASSATDLLYLFDELNAYSHDLRAATDLQELRTEDQAVDHRDGLAAMMAFLTVYAEVAREGEPATWAGLHEPRVARTIGALWGRAERVMAASCGIPNFGISDKTYIRRTCAAAGSGSALASLLGREPVCPSACLSPLASDEQASGEGEVYDASPVRAATVTSRQVPDR